MTAPNLATAASIVGKTAVLIPAPGPTAVVTCASNHVYRIMSCAVSNVTGAAEDVTIDLYRSSTAHRIAYQVTVPPKTTLMVLGRDAPVWLEESDALRGTSSTSSALEILVSYEDYS